MSRGKIKVSDMEAQRIQFLVNRDGVNATRTWCNRTLKIYRTAILNKNHHASFYQYRRSFIESYCEFKTFVNTQPVESGK